MGFREEQTNGSMPIRFAVLKMGSALLWYYAKLWLKKISNSDANDETVAYYGSEIPFSVVERRGR